MKLHGLNLENTIDFQILDSKEVIKYQHHRKAK